MDEADYIKPEPSTCYTLPVWNMRDKASDQAVCITVTSTTAMFILENRRRQDGTDTCRVGASW